MDTEILSDISYGMYVASTKYNDELCGCIVNTVTQITSKDIILSVSINKNNYTNEILHKSKRIAISILSEETSKDTIVNFGYKTSKETNKFENSYEVIDDLPVCLDNICGYIIGNIINVIDAETHEIFLIRVTNTKKMSDKLPMTYSFYQTNLKGTSPKNAPTYIEINHSNSNKYECIICGHIYDESIEKIKFEDLPDDWICPTCGVGKENFKKIN